jgi:hypothetical protein
LWEVLSQ